MIFRMQKLSHDVFENISQIKIAFFGFFGGIECESSALISLEYYVSDSDIYLMIKFFFRFFRFFYFDTHVFEMIYLACFFMRNVLQHMR